VLCWNVRGLNSDKKWNSIWDKIVDNNYDVVCLQGTKKDQFDSSFIRNICPQQFDSFAFKPSMGASGGILVCWKGSIFNGVEVFQNE